MGVWYVKKTYKDAEFVNYELYPFCVNKRFAFREEVPFYEKFHIQNKYINFLFLKFLKVFKKCIPSFYWENTFSFDPRFLSIRSWYIEWYFQCEKYFKEQEVIIRKDFEFSIPPSEKNEEIINIITSTNSVALHVRRWDYISNPANSLYNTCDLNYYHKAIGLMQEKIENPVFFLFSDDMTWVRENIHISGEAHYIDWNDNQRNYEDMRLMSLCRHNIIANSSFSWWGAWLNKSKWKIVVAPGIWFNDNKIDYSDVIPESWIKI